MNNLLKSNDIYFYRDKEKLCEKWSFIKKEKNSNMISFFFFLFFLTLFIGFALG